MTARNTRMKGQDDAPMNFKDLGINCRKEWFRELKCASEYLDQSTHIQSRSSIYFNSGHEYSSIQLWTDVTLAGEIRTHN